jgi:hypothetical protein
MQLQVLKLMWLDEQYVFMTSFWRNILHHKDSLTKLSIRMARSGNERSYDPILIEDFDRVTESSIIEENHRFNFARYASNDMICHSRVLVGLLQSNTQLKSLTLRNMILFEIAPTLVLQNNCI